MKRLLSLGLVGLTHLLPAATAAPLDALLSARHANEPLAPEVEIAYDLANKSVDFLGLRPSDSPKAGAPPSKSGDYTGAHLRLGMNLTPSLWVDGGLWQRSLDYTSVTASITSWQMGAQFKVIDGDSHSLALRAGAWGNDSPELRKTANAKVNGITFTSARQTGVRDRQLQFDAIGTWAVSHGLDLSAFAGLGFGRLSFDAVSATARMNGCEYSVEFSATSVVFTCPGGTVERIAAPNSVYGIDVQREAAYSSRHVHGGFNVRWNSESWRLGAGYQYMHIDRGTVDEIIAQRGGTPYPSNQFLVADAGYKATQHALVFVRAQLMAHQFVGEVPLSYNTLTAMQHRRRYGILTLGMSYAF